MILDGKFLFNFDLKKLKILKLRKSKFIWYGSTEDGRRDLTQYCDDWKSANAYFVGAANGLRSVNFVKNAF